MAKGLDKITEKTLKLWYEVNKKYGQHEYTLGVNALNEVILSKCYTEDIAKSTGQVQAKLKELLEL